MKKLSLKDFEKDIVKTEKSMSISGGYGGDEGNGSTTSNCTTHTTTIFGDIEGDTSYDGDWYSSC